MSLTHIFRINKKAQSLGTLPGGPVVKNPPFNAGDGGSIPDQGN